MLVLGTTLYQTFLAYNMNQPFGMGARPRIKTPEDKHLGAVQAPVTIPTVYKPDYSTLPVKMQGKFGTCGGHAGSALASFLNGQDLSPKFLWQKIKQIGDGVPNPNDGTTMNAIASTLKQTGDCHESLLPDTLPDTIEEYTNPADITQDMLNDAYTYGVDDFAYIDSPTWGQLKQAIYQNKVVIAAVDCGDGWYTNAAGQSSWLAKDILPIRLGNYVDGHFILLYGYDENYIYFRNSWGTQWACSGTSEGDLTNDGGDGYFDQTYIEHVKEIGTAIPAESVIGQQIISKYSEVVALLKQIIVDLKNKIN